MARSVGEAVGLLAERGDEAKILAGGLSLVPMMNFRLARPAAAVANAVRDALGLAGSVGQLPLTPARVRTLCELREGTA